MASNLRDAGDRPDEDAKERIDRELIELLNELRVALPGVQVLFAFMLVVPFSQRLLESDAVERWIYFAAFIAAALGAALLIAPSSYHRLRFRQGDKERMLHTSNRLLLSGMAMVAVVDRAVGRSDQRGRIRHRGGARRRDRDRRVARVVLVRPAAQPHDLQD